MLSLVVTVRDWPRERLDGCIRSFGALPQSVVGEIVVLDFGSSEPALLEASPPNTRLVRVEATRWSLAEATNAAVLAASGEIIAKTDADILIARDSEPGLLHALEVVASGEYDLLLAQVVDLPEGVSPATALADLEAGGRPEGRLRPRWGQGGLPIFRRELWQRLGGYDSRLTGWGSEDNDFCDRARRSGARVGWIEASSIGLFHVWHPPTYRQTHVARERAANRRLLEADRSIFRPLRFLNSDPSPVMAPAIVRSVTPLVTIAIATSPRPRRERMIAEAIASFRGPTASDCEVVVLDNGSDAAAHEALVDKLRPLTKQLSVRVEHSHEASIPKARNAITDLARGRYICIADDDDMALPNRVADHLRVFEQDGNAHGSYGGWIDFDEDSGLIEKNQGKGRTIANLLKGTGKILSHPSSFYRTDVLRAVPYDEALQLGSDWDLALRAGALGLRFLHTGSYVTLRRFHTSNVTLTGSSNQVSTGLMSRSRTWALYGSEQRRALVEMAKESDELLECRNDLSIDDLLHLLPDYVGTWRLLLPFASLGTTLPDGQTPLLEAVLSVLDGDLTTAASGINQEVLFCSEPVRGCRRVRRLLDTVSGIVGQRPRVISDRQLTIDRSNPFEWAKLAIPPGGGLVHSQRLATVADAVEAVSALPQNSLLRAAVQIISDFDEAGPAHYLAYHPTSNRSDVRQMMTELSALASVTFRYARSPSAPAIPLDFTDRFH